MLGCWKFPLTIPPSSINTRYRNGFSCKAETPKIHANNGDQSSNDKNNKKVVIVGSGWAGLGAANHLCNQGFDVAVLEDSNGFGSPDDVGIQGFWNPYQNIFSLVNELGITPFTDKLQSALYSTGGLEVEFPVFQDQPQLPTPLGTLYYTQFARLPLVDRLTSLPLMTAVIDFDNTDMAWRKYDSVTARELFKQFGCSKRLYQNVFGPLLQIGLFAPAEHCSAAATLGLLYYISLAHQKDFDMVWCRGTIREQIFNPWMELLRTKGCQFLDSGKVKDFVLNEETSCISEVVCSNGTYKADAVILAAGISEVQELVKNSAVLFTREEFLKVLNLAGIDVLTCKLQLDRKYHANELLPLKDELVVSKVMSYLSKCIKDFENANVTDTEIARFPKSLAHFFPGSYKYMMRGSTSFPNLFMAGDWIITRHGSWSQEKSYVTGLEAANRVVDLLGEGSFAKVIAVEEDEPHVEALRSLNRRFSEITEQFPLFDYFLQ
ncbi:uncharacterized protein LOC105638513 isoform X3 [Jatropha curcas]|uniref:uncharacterized protein LOC105638513 isoform X3 n=1 Tax=Jatropha curcas TaxID=180498 RepID=UPI0018947455|nr:uncharacterized protein LOC105638513 isoform X3 [Jatropha curcas]